MNKRGMTLIEMTVALIIGSVVMGLMVGVAVTETRTQVAEEYRYDVDFRARNLYKLISRDILLAGSMASSWDSTRAIRANGDTLVIRFSELDSVRYFLDGVDRIHRENVPIADQILSFIVTEDSISIYVSLDVAASNIHRWVNDGELYHRQYEWTVVPRTMN